MDRATFVQGAAARFEQGDDDGFVACFASGVEIYSEPELAERPFVTSRTELAAALASARRQLAGGRARLGEGDERGNGVLPDLIVLPSGNGDSGAWRDGGAGRVRGGGSGRDAPGRRAQR